MKRSISSAATAALAAAVLVALGAAPAAAQDGRVAEMAIVPGDTLALPGPGRVVGLTVAGADSLAFLLDVPDSLAASGRREVRLLLQGPGGKVLHDEDYTGVLDRGLAWTGKAFFACGDAPDGSSILYEITVDTLGALVVEGGFTAPGHRPMALAWDGRYLWVSDRDSGRLDRFDPEVGEFTRFVATPGFSPCGLAWDGSSMWLTDAGTGRLYRLVGARLRWNGVVDALSFLWRGADVLLWHDGSGLWYLPPGEAIAVRADFR